MPRDRTRIHLWYNFSYIVGILVIASITLMTVCWGQVPKLVELFTFGLTLTSLFLSLVAIIFMIVSSQGLSHGTASLRDAADDIDVATSTLGEAAEKLQREFGCLPERLESLETNFGQRFGKLEGMLAAGGTPADDSDVASSEKLEVLLDRVKDVSSISGALLMYICQVAHRTGKPFDLAKIGEIAATAQEQYAHGYLVASTATGLFDAVVNDGLWNITEFHVDDTDWRAEFIRKLDLARSEDSNVFKNRDDVLQLSVGSVDEYFGVKRRPVDQE